MGSCLCKHEEPMVVIEKREAFLFCEKCGLVLENHPLPDKEKEKETNENK